MIPLRYFSPEEFTMDGKVVFDWMDATFLIKLDECRHLANVTFKLSSSYRSTEKNKAVGGAKNSMHLKGRAVDILVSSDSQRWAIVNAAVQLGLSVGIMKNAVHIDNRDGNKVLFHYYDKYKKQ